MSFDISELPSFTFGDTPELADELLNLVLIGQKTATCGYLYYYETEGVPVPQAGDRYVILDGAGKPGCVVEMVDVSIRRFNEIDEVWAVLEGEGDLSLEHWQREHKAYFERLGVFSSQMELVCEYFKLIKVFKQSGQDTTH